MKIAWRVLGIHLLLSACAWVLGPSTLMSRYEAVSYAAVVAFIVLTIPGGAVLSYFVPLEPDAPFWERTAIDAAVVAATQLILLGLVSLVLAVRRRVTREPPGRE